MEINNYSSVRKLYTCSDMFSVDVHRNYEISEIYSSYLLKSWSFGIRMKSN